MPYTSIRKDIWARVKKLVQPELDELLKRAPLSWAFFRNGEPIIEFWLKSEDTKPQRQRNAWGIHLAAAMPKWVLDAVREEADRKFRPDIEKSCSEISTEEARRKEVEKKLRTKKTKYIAHCFDRSEGRTEPLEGDQARLFLYYWLEIHGDHSDKQRNIRRYLYHALKAIEGDCYRANESKGMKHLSRWIATNSVLCSSVALLDSMVDELAQTITAKLKTMISNLCSAVNQMVKHLDSTGNLQDAADEEIKASVESELLGRLGEKVLQQRALEFWPQVVGKAIPAGVSSFQQLYMAVPGKLREDYCRALVFNKTY